MQDPNGFFQQDQRGNTAKFFIAVRKIFADIAQGIGDRCGWIAPISVYPGEMEQEALALGALKVLRGEEEALTYSGEPVWKGLPFFEEETK